MLYTPQKTLSSNFLFPQDFKILLISNLLFTWSNSAAIEENTPIGP